MAGVAGEIEMLDVDAEPVSDDITHALCSTRRPSPCGSRAVRGEPGVTDVTNELVVA